MEEPHSKPKAVALPPPPSDSTFSSENSEGCKTRNCLCAPTTHAGSFRCRLHRRPPAAPALSQHAVKKVSASQKTLSPKVKLALQHKLKQGCTKRSSSSFSTSSRLHQEAPGPSRLSRTSGAVEQIPESFSDQEASTTLWKTSIIGDQALESTSQIASSEASGVESSSGKETIHTRPLVKLPSI